MDLSYIVLADNPPEWNHTLLDPELIELLEPDPKTGMLPLWAAKVYQAVDSDRWYFLTNEERTRTVGQDGSGRVETYLTKLGIEWPYRGALRLFTMYERTERERGKVHGVDMIFERTLATMRRRGKHQPVSIDRAYANWQRARERLRVNEREAERLLGPMPRRHIHEGWPVGMKEKIRAKSQHLYIP